MTVFGRRGIWQATDHRVTDNRTGRIIEDDAAKQLHLRCTDGAALVTFTGLAMVGSRPMADWFRGTFRGRTGLSIDDSLLLLKRRASAELARRARELRAPHNFIVGLYLQDQQWLVAMSNARWAQAGTVEFMSEFLTTGRRIDTWEATSAGAGMLAISQDDHQLLRQFSQAWPKDPVDGQKLLAAIVRRTAESKHPASKTVSATCDTSFMTAEADHPFSSILHTEKGGRPRSTPFVVEGIDLTDMLAMSHDSAVMGLPRVDPEEF